MKLGIDYEFEQVLKAYFEAAGSFRDYKIFGATDDFSEVLEWHDPTGADLPVKNYLMVGVGWQDERAKAVTCGLQVDLVTMAGEKDSGFLHSMAVASARGLLMGFEDMRDFTAGRRERVLLNGLEAAGPEQYTNSSRSRIRVFDYRVVLVDPDQLSKRRQT